MQGYKMIASSYSSAIAPARESASDGNLSHLLIRCHHQPQIGTLLLNKFA